MSAYGAVAITRPQAFNALRSHGLQLRGCSLLRATTQPGQQHKKHAPGHGCGTLKPGSSHAVPAPPAARPNQACAVRSRSDARARQPAPRPARPAARQRYQCAQLDDSVQKNQAPRPAHGLRYRPETGHQRCQTDCASAWRCSKGSAGVMSWHPGQSRRGWRRPPRRQRFVSRRHAARAHRLHHRKVCDGGGGVFGASVPKASSLAGGLDRHCQRPGLWAHGAPVGWALRCCARWALRISPRTWAIMSSRRASSVA